MSLRLYVRPLVVEYSSPSSRMVRSVVLLAFLEMLLRVFFVLLVGEQVIGVLIRVLAWLPYTRHVWPLIMMPPTLGWAGPLPFSMGRLFRKQERRHE